MRVECYAGHRGDEEPRWLWIDGERVEVVEILERWREPGARFFRVRAGDGKSYLLVHEGGDWALSAARKRS